MERNDHAEAGSVKGDDSLLVEVLLKLGSAEWIEQHLVDRRKTYRKGVDVLGAFHYEANRVYINHLAHKRRADIVSTLLHEGIHQTRPQWTERGVDRAERRLMRLLTDNQVDAIHRQYKQAVRRLKGTKEV